MPAPDDIPLRRGEIDLVTALSVARDLPDEALDLAAERPGRVLAAVRAVADKVASGAEIDERETNLLFWGLFVVGHARDEAFCPVLLRLLAIPDERLYGLFGEDVVLGAMPRLLVSVFDGDPDPAFRLLGDQAVDENLRMTLFGALARLTHEGRIPTERMRSFVRDFDRARPVRPGDAGWHGWEAAIGLLGFSDLLPLVDFAHEDGRLLGAFAERGWCAELCRETADPTAREALFEAEELTPLGHPVEEADAYLALAAEDDEGGEDDGQEAGETVRNEFRDVGRNDPCPCGSGKKYKKCCLAAV